MLSMKYFAKTSCIFLQLFIGRTWENTGKEGIDLVSAEKYVQDEMEIEMEKGDVCLLLWESLVLCSPQKLIKCS